MRMRLLIRPFDSYPDTVTRESKLSGGSSIEASAGTIRVARPCDRRDSSGAIGESNRTCHGSAREPAALANVDLRRH